VDISLCLHVGCLYHSLPFIYSDCIKQTVQLLSVSLRNILLCCYSQLLTPVRCSVDSRSNIFRIATRYGADGSGFEHRDEQDFTHHSRPTSTPTQSPLLDGSGLCPGGKAVGAWI
jgi:hypothetical protein